MRVLIWHRGAGPTTTMQLPEKQYRCSGSGHCLAVDCILLVFLRRNGHERPNLDIRGFLEAYTAAIPGSRTCWHMVISCSFVRDFRGRTCGGYMASNCHENMPLCPAWARYQQTIQKKLYARRRGTRMPDRLVRVSRELRLECTWTCSTVTGTVHSIRGRAHVNLAITVQNGRAVRPQGLPSDLGEFPVSVCLYLFWKP